MSEGSRPFVIAVSNRKGGTGKTTSCVNIASAAALNGFKVLLIDLDTQGHSHFGLGITLTKGQLTAHDLFKQDQVWSEVHEAIVATTIPNLDVIPADVNFDGSNASRDMNRLKSVIEASDQLGHYDVIILDTPPALDLLLINAMTAAQAVLVPVLPHVLSIEGVKQLIRLFFKVASSANAELSLLGFVPVMLNLRTGLHRVMVESLKKQYGKERVFRGIRSDISLAESFASGTPIQIYDPKSRGAEDYQYLWEQMQENWKPLAVIRTAIRKRK
jgi:chromosome partitioning protein